MSVRIGVSIDEGVAEVRLNRPDKLNALDPAMFEALLSVTADLARRPGLRSVVLCGEGRAFCAGLDLQSMMALAAPGAARASPLGELLDVEHLDRRSHGLANAFQQVAWAWHELPVPVIAAVHGVAYGGGLQIALGADVRLVAEDVALSVMEIKWGIVPDMAGMVLMKRLLRGDVMRELVYTGRTVSAAEAVQIGLATRVSADPLVEARALARQIAAQSPDAVRAAKRLLNRAMNEPAADVLLAESTEQQRLLGRPNQVEAVRAGLARRSPVFQDPADA